MAHLTSLGAPNPNQGRWMVWIGAVSNVPSGCIILAPILIPKRVIFALVRARTTCHWTSTVLTHIWELVARAISREECTR